MTVDTVGVEFGENGAAICPSDSGYFADNGTGVATNSNALTGESRVVHKRQKYGLTTPLVALEASDDDPRLNKDTFYETYTGRGSHADRREPLGKTWGARYLAVNRKTVSELVVWRDTDPGSEPFECGQLGELGENAWYPLLQDEIVAYEDAEEALEVPESPFPAATQVVQIGKSGLPLPGGFDRGWVYLDLDTSSSDEVFRPSFVAVRHTLGNRRIHGQHFAALLESACKDP